MCYQIWQALCNLVLAVGCIQEENIEQTSSQNVKERINTDTYLTEGKDEEEKQKEENRKGLSIINETKMSKKKC